LLAMVGIAAVIGVILFTLHPDNGSSSSYCSNTSIRGTQATCP
jgi:hypothetical protein